VSLSTARLDLVPLSHANAADLAAAMAGVLSGPLYGFIGGAPPTAGELAARYARLAAGRSPDGSQEWWNWIIRLRPDAGAAVGTVQATIADGGRSAEIAWLVGVPWQGCGYASEAARALVGWLDGRGVQVITACIHPRHDASAAVAQRAGLSPTGEFRDGERIWRRERPTPG
jgi:RimJ/RimL family protein N-acetyltransferase